MKIAMGMKSNFAFDRLRTTLLKFEYSNQIEVHTENIQELHTLDDVVEFWKPELIILDSKLPIFDDLDILASQKEIEVAYFNSDFEAIVDHIKSYFIDDDIEEQSEKRDFNIYQDEVKTEVVVKDRIVEKEVIKTAYTSIPNKLIVVASMWQGAGSTTFATNLSRALAERGLNVSYVEFPLSKPYMFDYLSIPVKEEEEGRRYFDQARQISEGKNVKRKDEAWREHDIDWYVNDSREVPVQGFTYEEMLKYVYSINSTITIVDVSSNLHNPNIQKFLHHVDDIYICVEPDPIKVDWLASITSDGKNTAIQRTEKKVIDYLNHIEQKENISFQFVNMKYTKVIDNQSFWLSLGKKPISFFPVVDYEVLISLTWKSDFLYDLVEYRDLVEKALKPVIVRSVPRQYYEIEKEKESSINKILKVFRKGEK